MTDVNEAYAKCQNEQQFKMAWLKRRKNTRYEDFCIETEETVKGFPDVMSIKKLDSTCCFYEFKYTKTGKIKFQPTQPAFYRAHPDLRICVVAYNAKTNCVHQFGTACLFNKDSKYYMTEKAEVDLTKAEV
jgi:hypothetical protein